MRRKQHLNRCHNDTVMTDRILIKNAYLINNQLHYFCMDDAEPLDLSVRISSTDMLADNIVITKFPTLAALNAHVHKLDAVMITGCTCYASHFYDWNVAHGLYDTLYPLYLCYLWYVQNQVEQQKNEPFNILLKLKRIPGFIFPGHASRQWVLDIFAKFCNGKMITMEQSMTEDEVGQIDQVLRFEYLCVGHADSGLVNVNGMSQMLGKELGGLEYFRDRMLYMYDVQPLSRHGDGRPRLTFINSRRYTHEERIAMNNVIMRLKQEGKCDVHVIDWRNKPNFREQLKIMQDTDIHISGAGTAMLNFPFLRDGTHHINLGVVQIDECKMPGLLEVNICLLSNTIKILYYDIFKYGRIRETPLQNIINRAIAGEQDGVPLYIQVWRQYCREDTEITEVLESMNGRGAISPHLMGLRHPELLVYEHSRYAAGTKLINTDILRRIKTDMALPMLNPIDQ